MGSSGGILSGLRTWLTAPLDPSTSKIGYAIFAIFIFTVIVFYSKVLSKLEDVA